MEIGTLCRLSQDPVGRGQQGLQVVIGTPCRLQWSLQMEIGTRCRLSRDPVGTGQQSLPVVIGTPPGGDRQDGLARFCSRCPGKTGQYDQLDSDSCSSCRNSSPPRRPITAEIWFSARS
jgi:hypothetical protein